MYLGLDLGATNLRALVAGDDFIRGRTRTSTPSDGSIPEAIVEVIREVCNRANCEPASLQVAGIASIGPFDDGCLRNPANLHQADGLDPRSVVGDTLDTAEVILINDATAAAVAEAGAADAAHLVYLTLSTGVGAGVVDAGRPLLGNEGNAGEVGHVVLDPTTNLECGCGGVGHWEALCGGANLVAHARAIAVEGVETELDMADANPEMLLSNAGTDPLATELVDRLGLYNAQGAALLVAAYDPSRLVVGGGLAQNHPERLLEPIRSNLRNHGPTEAPPVALTRHGDDAAVRGALMLARRRDRNR